MTANQRTPKIFPIFNKAYLGVKLYTEHVLFLSWPSENDCTVNTVDP